MKFKTFALWAVIAIVIFFVVSNPSHAATSVQGILTALRHGAEAVITFISNIFR